MKAMKEQMTMMMEAMMSMRKLMEVNAATTVTANTTTKRDPIHLFDFNQEGHPILDVVGQGGEARRWQMRMGLIMSRSRASLLFHHMVCLQIIHYLLLYMFIVRILVILHLYSLRVNNLNPFIPMPMSLNPWGKHMKLPKTTLWPVSWFIRDIPLKGMHFLVSSCQMLQGTLMFCERRRTSYYSQKGKF